MEPGCGVWLSEPAPGKKQAITAITTAARATYRAVFEFGFM